MLYLNLFNEHQQSAIHIVGLVLLRFIGCLVIIIPLWIYDFIKMSSYIKETNNMEKAKILNLFLAKNSQQAPINAEVIEKEIKV